MRVCCLARHLSGMNPNECTHTQWVSPTQSSAHWGNYHHRLPLKLPTQLVSKTGTHTAAHTHTHAAAHALRRLQHTPILLHTRCAHTTQHTHPHSTPSPTCCVSHTSQNGRCCHLLLQQPPQFSQAVLVEQVQLAGLCLADEGRPPDQVSWQPGGTGLRGVADAAHATCSCGWFVQKERECHGGESRHGTDMLRIC